MGIHRLLRETTTPLTLALCAGVDEGSLNLPPIEVSAVTFRASPTNGLFVLWDDGGIS